VLEVLAVELELEVLVVELEVKVLEVLDVEAMLVEIADLGTELVDELGTTGVDEDKVDDSEVDSDVVVALVLEDKLIEEYELVDSETLEVEDSVVELEALIVELETALVYELDIVDDSLEL